MNKLATLFIALALAFATVSAGNHHLHSSVESELYDAATEALVGSDASNVAQTETSLIAQAETLGNEIGLKFNDEAQLDLDQTNLTDILLKSGYTHCAGQGEICNCPADNGLVVYGHGEKYTTPSPAKGSMMCEKSSFDRPQEYTTKFHDPKTGGNWLITIKKKKNFLRRSFLSFGEESPKYSHARKMCLCKVSSAPSFLEFAAVAKYNKVMDVKTADLL